MMMSSKNFLVRNAVAQGRQSGIIAMFIHCFICHRGLRVICVRAIFSDNVGMDCAETGPSDGIFTINFFEENFPRIM